ncbi:Zinc finger MYM-type protein 4 [Halotydeus destructor]|nr:Zinc finger MYM-type protein 4 [Halotydeus destructor]
MEDVIELPTTDEELEAESCRSSRDELTTATAVESLKQQSSENSEPSVKTISLPSGKRKRTESGSIEEDVRKDIDRDSIDEIELGSEEEYIDELDDDNDQCDSAIEISIEPGRISNEFDSCLICEDPSVKYKVFRNGNIEYLCNETCLNQFRKSRESTCNECKVPIDIDSLGYMPRFGQQNSAVCSNTCLIKYEVKSRPLVSCKNCNKTIKRDSKTSFHWQTVDFCSAQCVVRLLKTYSICAFCKGYVATPSRGKYAVRFGSSVRQFCNAVCLDRYKKRGRTCTFCQGEVTDTSRVVCAIGDSNGRRKEFCSPDCFRSYKDVLDAQAQKRIEEESFESNMDFCDICSVLILKASENAIKLKLADRQFSACSEACVAAFRFKYKISCCYCDNCGNAHVISGKINILTANGRLRIFCSARCVTLFVLKTRTIVSCTQCNVKKYSFDLVERYDRHSDRVQLFCSVQCLNSLANREPQHVALDSPTAAGNGSKAAVENGVKKMIITCGSCQMPAEAKFHLKANEKHLQSFCSLDCVNKFQETLRTQNSPNITASKTPIMNKQVLLINTSQSTPVLNQQFTSNAVSSVVSSAAMTVSQFTGLSNSRPGTVLVALTSTGASVIRPAAQTVPAQQAPKMATSVTPSVALKAAEVAPVASPLPQTASKLKATITPVKAPTEPPKASPYSLRRRSNRTNYAEMLSDKDIYDVPEPVPTKVPATVTSVTPTSDSVLSSQLMQIAANASAKFMSSSSPSLPTTSITMLSKPSSVSITQVPAPSSATKRPSAELASKSSAPEIEIIPKPALPNGSTESATIKIVYLKERPSKKQFNSSTQVTMSTTSQATMCKPNLVDAGCQTD